MHRGPITLNKYPDFSKADLKLLIISGRYSVHFNITMSKSRRIIKSVWEITRTESLKLGCFVHDFWYTYLQDRLRAGLIRRTLGKFP